MESRNFKLDTEWNVIHYPERPNGFGILMIGDERHFVSSNSSFWTQNEGKRSLLNIWKKEGYTVFYSNLYGRHWGSEKAVELTLRLCSHIVRNEILNTSFHLVAEGMGALVALKLLKHNDFKIRSLVLINPILSLSTHLEQEKENKFFYKKLVAELEAAYETDINTLLESLDSESSRPAFNKDTPVKIIQVLSGNRAYKQSSIIKELSVEWEKDDLPVTLSYVLPEKMLQVGSQIVQFFRKHEQVL
ncbi:MULTISPECIES: hydrolase [unclassified Bacillus (in: firmicutes)]|uniref:hydrolase n=1 Tax=unclassified Bacillus (in: firmicutes) TaxID=185979 RepID=UPI001BE586DC|nr:MULTISPECIES: hydrolase [unclassified Bacillus (in: firmicutes)]MBT2639195.1 hydrolase [Bacillus sp. ISL-39]MBT2659875.1 hydrolase [Bacillus sp. ISL-45]